MSRIDEEHGGAAGTGILQRRFQLRFEEAGLLLGVFLDCLLGRHRDRCHFAVTQPEVGLEEGTHLGQTATHARLLKDDLGGLFGVAWWVVPEVLLDRLLVLQQLRLGAAPLAATHLLQPALRISGRRTDQRSRILRRDAMLLEVRHDRRRHTCR